jgi:hypothetical protein
MNDHSEGIPEMQGTSPGARKQAAALVEDIAGPAVWRRHENFRFEVAGSIMQVVTTHKTE